MKIKHLEIQNFRKLKSCRIDVSKKETVLVGANNSGKTSAMDALIYFLQKKGELKTTDFTLSNWVDLNNIGEKWLAATEENPIELSLDEWIEVLPTLDLWLDVNDDEVHYVSHLIPSLDWKGGLIGVRFIYFPKDLELLYKNFKEQYLKARDLKAKFDVWPLDIKDFLDKNIESYFELRSYKLNPNNLVDPQKGVAIPQIISNFDLNLGTDPLKGIVRVNIINAQRGFSDSSNEEDVKSGKLSKQLREYYSKHLNPEDNPTIKDLDALTAISDAQTSFDTRLEDSFKPAIGELETLGYPGFSDPNITITSKVNPMDSLKHSASVKFNLFGDKENDSMFYLPENYNGLGYQNLVSMVFRLIRFRDGWLRIGKNIIEEEIIEPIHLVLIEEPEAHLHVQVQQVFIRKAHDVLTNNSLLADNTHLSMKGYHKSAV